MLKPAYRFGMVMKRGLREQEEPLILKGKAGIRKMVGFVGEEVVLEEECLQTCFGGYGKNLLAGSSGSTASTGPGKESFGFR